MNTHSIFELRIKFLLSKPSEFRKEFDSFFESCFINDKKEIDELISLKNTIFDSDDIPDNDKKHYINVINECHVKFNKSSKKDYYKIVKNELESGKISLDNNFPDEILSNINIIHNNNKLIENNRIICLDKNNTQFFDGAFSISKDGNEYHIDAYITDVVSFLNYNRELAHIAYERGMNYYIRKDKYTIRSTMLPDDIVNNYLSLNTNDYKDVIQFSFFINDNGRVINTGIKLSKIKVNYQLFEDKTAKIVNGIVKSPISTDLQYLKEVAAIIKKHKYLYYINFSGNLVDKMISIPSLLVNHIVARDSSFAIYKRDGQYSKIKTSYAHSSTPIRNIVSDINLGIFMNHQGIGNINDSDIYRIEDNLDEIIEHLNKKNALKKYLTKNEEYVQRKIK